MGDIRTHVFANVYADSFNGPGTGITGLDPATAFVPLPVNSVVTTNGLGIMGTTAIITTTNGGTGSDLSGSTGGLAAVLTNTNGTVSNGPIVATYGATASTVPTRDTYTGALHDSVAFVCDGLGTPAVADREFAQLRWNSGDSRYYLETSATGTGTLRPLYMNASTIFATCHVGANIAASAPEDFVRKAEFDTAIMGVTWQAAVLAITNAPTFPYVDGDRYIASATIPVPAWTLDHIYQWSAASATWIDTTPLPGWGCFVRGGVVYPDQTVVYTDPPSTWSPLGISIDHYDLLHRGTNTHSQLDGHLATVTTDPHAGQDLRAIASPTHASLTLSSVLPTLTFENTAVGPPTPGTTALTLTTSGALQYSRPNLGTVGVMGLDMQTGYVMTPLVAIPTGLQGVKIGASTNVAVATYPLEVHTGATGALRLVQTATAYEASFDIMPLTGELRTNAPHGEQITTRLGVGTPSEDNVAIAALCATGEQLRLYYDATHYTTITVQNDGSLDIAALRVPAADATVRFAARNPVSIQNTTVSSSISTGALIVAGGIGVTGRVYATNVTCVTAPTAATDVVRLSDLSSGVVMPAIPWNGFPSTAAAESTLSLDEGTRIFSITPTGANFTFWSNGTKYTKTVVQTATVTATAGMHYLYFDGTGTLVETTIWSDDIILLYCFAASVYWSTTSSGSLVPGSRIIGDERHGFIMSASTHRNIHYTNGSVYLNGLTPGGFTIGSGATDNHAQFTITQGTILDEDYTTTENAKALTDLMRVYFYFNDGVHGSQWNYVTSAAAVYDFAGPAQIGYNTISTGTLTRLTDDQFVLAHIFASNDIGYKCAAILGQNCYTSLAAARTAAATELQAIELAGLPTAEMVFIATVIYQGNTTYGNTYKARIVEVSAGVNFVDWRETSLSSGSSSSITVHANLSGLASDDHLQYLLLTGRVGDTVTIPNTTASTSPTVGAVVITGGLGVGNNISCGAEMRAFDITAPFTAYTRLWHNGTNSYFDCTAASRIFNYNTNFSTIKILATTTSTNISTGALVISGGLGVAGTVCSGTELRVYDTVTPFTYYTALYHTGANSYLGVSTSGQTLNVSASFSVTKFLSNTGSTSNTTGAVTIAGGLGVVENVNIGQRVGIGAPAHASIKCTIYQANAATPQLQLTNWNGSASTTTTLFTSNNATGGFTLESFNGTTNPIRIGNATYGNVVTIAATTASTSPTTGGLIAAGGLGVATNACVGAELRTFDITTPFTAYTRLWHNGTSSYFDCTAASRTFSFQPNFSTVNVASTTACSSDTVAALTVAGGLGVTGGAQIRGNTSIGAVAPDANVALSVYRVGSYAQLQLTNYTGSTVTTTAFYTSTAATGGLTIDAFGGTTNPITIGNNAHGDIVTIASTAASTSPTTGGLIASGGLGVATNACIGAELRAFDITTPFTAYTRFWHNGTTSTIDCTAASRTFSFAINFSTVAVAATTASSSQTTGALTVAGGLGVATNACIGAELRTFDITTPFSAYTRLWHNGTTSTIDCTAASRTLSIASNFASLSVAANTVSSSISTGAIISAGGIGAAGRVYATNMTCVTAPTAATDVLRLSDLSSGVVMPTIPWNGFPSTAAAESTLALDEGTRIFSITPTGANFTFWSNGTKYTKTVLQTVTVTATAGMHYLYFDGTGTLVETTVWSDDIILLYCFAASVYWSTTSSGSLVPGSRIIGDERHGFIMSAPTHRNIHYTNGSVYLNGLTPGGFTIGSGATDNHAQFTITQGTILDEDYTTTENAKVLTDLMRVYFYFNDGVHGSQWNYVTSAAAVYDFAGPAQIGYNTISTGTLTRLTDDQFVLAHIFASNDIGYKCAAILGQNCYTSLAAARTAAATELQAIELAGLPSAEMVFIATVIYQGNTTYGNTYKARIVEVSAGVNFVDWRDTSLSSGSSSSVTVHANLSGLASDDHLQYLLLTGRVGDTVVIPNTTASSSPTVGAVVITGGLGVGNNISCGAEVRMFDITTPFSAYTRLWHNGTTSTVDCTAASRTFSFATNFSAVAVAATTASSSQTTGALTVAGGLGVATNACIGAELRTFDITTPFSAYTRLWHNGTTSTIDCTAAGRTISIASNFASLSVAASTVASSISTGAIISAGGIGAAGRVYATNMTCVTAPTAATDVLRLSDLSGGVVVPAIPWNGFPSTVAAETTISLDEGTRIFSLTPTGANFTFWSNGVKYTKTVVQTATVTATAGLHYIYFDGTGTLVETTMWSDDLILLYCIVSIVYWSTTSSGSLVPGSRMIEDERHGFIMSASTHRNIHYTRGASYLNGLTPGGFTIGSGATDNHAQFTITQGSILDEDYVTTENAKALTDLMRVYFYFNDGVHGSQWNYVTSAAAVYNFSAPAQIGYNTISTGSLTRLTDGQYVLAHIFASNDTTYKCAAILGQGNYGNIIAARNAAATELNSIQLAGLPAAEMVFIATVIYQGNTAYGNTYKARIVEVSAGVNFVDWRTAKMTGVASSTTVHANLSGLASDDHLQYLLLTGRIGDTVVIPNTTASTSPTVGAVVITGGLGVGNNISCGAEVRAFDITTPFTAYTRLWHNGTTSTFDCTAASRTFSFATNFSTIAVAATTASSSQTTGALTVAGGLGVATNACIGAEMRTFDITTPFSAYTRLWHNGTTTTFDCTAASRTFSFATNFSIIAIASTTATSSRTTGALTVAGGISALGNIASGTELRAYDETTPFTGYTALYHNGVDTHLGTNAASRVFNISGSFLTTKILSTNASVSSVTGALTIAGGLGVAGVTNIGGNVGIGLAADANIPCTIYNNSTYAQLQLLNWIGSYATTTFYTSHAATGGLTIDSFNGTTNPITIGVAAHGNVVTIGATTASTSPTTGGLIAAGGLGVASNACVGAELRTFDITTPFTAYTRLWHNGTSSYFDCSAASRTFNFQPNFSTVAIAGTTTSSSPTTGAETIIGGLGVGGNVCTGAELRTFDITTPFTAYTRLWHNGTNSYFDCDAASRTFNFQSNFSTVNVAANTATVSTTTGAMTIAGGLGIVGNVNIGQRVGIGAIADASIKCTIYQANAAIAQLQLLNWNGSATTTTTFFTSNNATGGLIIDSFNGTTNPIKIGVAAHGNITTIAATTASTSPTTGGLIAAGGLGVATNACIGAELRTFDITTPFTAYTRLWHNGTNSYFDCDAASRTFNFQPNFSTVAIAGTTASSSPTTGAETIIGGLGVGGNVCTGAEVRTFDITTPFTAYTRLWHNGTISYLDCDAASRTFRFNSNFATVNIAANTVSSNNATGALTIAGGVGIIGKLNVGGYVGIGTPADANMACTIYRLGGYPQLQLQNYTGSVMINAFFFAATAATGGLTISANGGTTNPITIGNASYTNDVIVASTTAASSISSGSLTVGGGIGVPGRVYATNMTCVTAPAAATDVVRLTDLSSGLAIPAIPWNGFPSTAAAESTIALDEGTRIFSLTPTGANFTFWSNGTKYTKTVAQTATVTASAGFHYLYFDGTGTLVEVSVWSDDIILLYCFVATVYWSTTSSGSLVPGSRVIEDERHGYVMSAQTARNLYYTHGLTYLDGITPGDFTIAAGNLDSHAQFTLTQGHVLNEDYSTTVTAKALTDLMRVYFYFDDGVHGVQWNYITSAAPVYDFSAPAQVGYNAISGTLTRLADDQFVLAHIFASNDVGYKCAAIVGQDTYASELEARDAAAGELRAIRTAGLPAKEMVFIMTVIYQGNTTYGNTYKARVVYPPSLSYAYIDWRTESITNIPPASHGNLANLTFDDHPQYWLTNGRPGDVLYVMNTDTPGKTCALESADTTGDFRIYAARYFRFDAGGSGGGEVHIDSTTASTSTSTGALIVTGGAAVGGALHANTVHAMATTISTSPTTGAVIVDGGIGAAADSYYGGNLTTHDTVIANEGAFGAPDPDYISFLAQYFSSINADVGVTTTGTPTGAPAITNNMLDLTGGIASRYVSYATGNSIGAIGTIRCKFTPNFTGTPTNHEMIFSTDLTGPIYLDYFTAGTLQFSITYLGDTLTLTYNAFSVVAGTTYDIEVDFDTTGDVRSDLYVNGISVANATGTFSRAAVTGLICVGSNANDPNNAIYYPDFYVSDLQVYDGLMLHTSNFIPPPVLLSPYALVAGGLSRLVGPVTITGTTSITGTASATNINCTTAPATANAVVRYAELTTYPATLMSTLSGYWGPTTTNACTQTIYLQRFGSVTFVCASRPSLSGTMSSTSALTYSVTLSNSYIDVTSATHLRAVILLSDDGTAASANLQIEGNGSTCSLIIRPGVDYTAGTFTNAHAMIISPWSAVVSMN